MAITQDRIISIINAGLDYKRAFARLIQIIDEQRGLTADIWKLERVSDLEKLDKAISIIYRSAGPGLLDDSNSAGILEVEAQHFQSTHGRNERNRLKAERRRREAGVKPQLKRNYGEPVRVATTRSLHQPILPQAPRAQASETHETVMSPEESKRIVQEALEGWIKDE